MFNYKVIKIEYILKGFGSLHFQHTFSNEKKKCKYTLSNFSTGETNHMTVSSWTLELEGGILLIPDH